MKYGGFTKDQITGLKSNFEGMVISEFVHIEGLKHVVRSVRAELSRINVVSRVVAGMRWAAQYMVSI